MKTTNHITKYILIFTMPALLLTGCITRMSQQGGAWSGNPPSLPQVAGTLALDAATAPIQAPIWAYAINHDIRNNIYHAKEQRGNRGQASYLDRVS